LACPQKHSRRRGASVEWGGLVVRKLVLSRRPHETDHGEDMRLRRAEARSHEGCEKFLARFKLTPVTPTSLPRTQSSVLSLNRDARLQRPNWDGAGPRSQETSRAAHLTEDAVPLLYSLRDSKCLGTGACWVTLDERDGG